MSETKTDRLCRTCMNDSNSHSPIYRELCLEDSILFEVINDVCQLEVTEGDGLPEYICHDCLAKLSEFQKFKCRAHEVNVALQRMKEHELNSESESLPWESSKTEEESNFEQENDGSDLGSKELCGTTLALHHDWIKPDYSAREHEKVDVNPAGVDQVEVKVEPEDSFDDAFNGREDTQYEEYIGIEPDDLAYNAVGFDGTTPATTDPLQVPVNVTELKQESFSPERSHPTKDTFLTDGLKEEDLSPEAMPVQVTCSSTHGTLEEEAKEKPRRQREVTLKTIVTDISRNEMFIDKSEDANSIAETGRFRKTTAANNGLEGKRRKKTKVYQRTHDVVIENGHREKKEMKNISFGVVAQDGSRLVTQQENLSIKENMEYLKRAHSCSEERKANLIGEESEEATSIAATGRFWKISAKSRVEGISSGKSKVYKGIQDVVVQNDSLGKKGMANSSVRVVVQDGGWSDTHLDLENQTGDEQVENLYCKGVACLPSESTAVENACPVCWKSYKDVYYLEAHMRSSHPGDDEGRMLKPWFNQKRFFCDTCGKGYDRRGHLAVHILLHSGVKLHKCDVCSKAFGRKKDLTLHTRFHRSVKPHECHLCKKKFSQRANLKSHLKTHEGPPEKKFECTFCGKRYAQKVGLENHLTTHSDEKRFLCNYCGKTYKLDQSLKLHLRRVHGGEKRFGCDICRKEFFLKWKLISHILSHGDDRPYACEVCDKTFKTRENARTHQKTHGALKPHCCTFCAKRFLRTGNLRQHLRTHTGERPFECSSCGKRFNQSSSLRRHIKSYCKREATV